MSLSGRLLKIGINIYGGIVDFTNSTSFQLGGVQVIGKQQAAIVDVSASTTVAQLPPATYTPHIAGATAVTSNAATDLDTTAAALATLQGEVAAYETAISALIADVAVIRVQTNDLLAKVRTHGIIAT